MTLARTPLRRRTSLRTKTGLRPRRKTRKGQVPEAVLDALWSRRVRQRDTACVVWRMGPLTFGSNGEKCAGPIQAAHIYSRKYRGVRFDTENGLGLCAKHHTLMHDNPVQAGRFYESVLGRKKLDWLWAKAQAAGKVNRAAVKDYLKAQLKEYEKT